MRVTHTPFSTPVRAIGRDAELTIALNNAIIKKRHKKLDDKLTKELTYGVLMFGRKRSLLFYIVNTLKILLK